MYSTLAIASTFAALAAAAPLAKRAPETKVFGLFDAVSYLPAPVNQSCGFANVSTEFVVSIKTNSTNTTAHCGQTVNITNFHTGDSVLAQVVDECISCAYEYLALSPAPYAKVSSNKTFSASYYYTDAEAPVAKAETKESVSAAAAPAAASSSSSSKVHSKSSSASTKSYAKSSSKSTKSASTTKSTQTWTPSSSAASKSVAKSSSSKSTSSKPTYSKQSSSQKSSSKSSSSSAVAKAAYTPKTTSSTSSKAAAYTPKTTSSSTSTKAAYTPKTSSSSKAAATTSKKASSSSSSGSYSGQATWYTQNGNAGACGNYNSDSAYIVALQSSMYAGGAHCGQSVRITNTNSGSSITATVADECPTCASSGSLDLSTAAFQALGSLDAGVLSISWSFA